MKNKPILIALAGAVLLAGTTFLLCCRNSSNPEKAEINQFLYGFSNRVNEGNTKALLAFFEVNKAPKSLKRLVNLLAGKKDIGGKGKPIARVDLDVDNSTIHIVDADMVIANIPAKFSHDSLENKRSLITLKIHQVSPHKFKIVQIDVRKFLTDYAEYANYVRSKTVPETDIFSPITLAAFKTAEQLKTRYDSVIWFEHIEGKTYYYVVKGKWDRWNIDSINNKNHSNSYKMGLVNPELKEIIPAEYDLIHNINGTFTGLIEVEKNQKKGLFDVNGKNILPANYDEILPLKDNLYIATLRVGTDYFYLQKDYSVTAKVDGFNISEILNKIIDYGNSYSLAGNHPENILEYNTREISNSIILPPSYLVDWEILPNIIMLRNPIRKAITFDDMEEGDAYYKINFEENIEANDWLQGAFYSIINDYLGGRGGLYQSNAVLVIDKKRNRIYGHQVNIFFAMSEGGVVLSGKCKNNHLMPVNDSLFEYETTAFLARDMGENQLVGEAPYYYYLTLKDGKLQSLPNERFFGFTKYVKMDDSYLKGFYIINDKTIHGMTSEMIQYAKNEIFAEYQYKFKNPKWADLFQSRFNRDGAGKYTNVDDSLTEIDKYNINFLNEKIKKAKSGSNTLAAK